MAITTIGRPALAELLLSAASSTSPPAAVAVADQSGGRLPLIPERLPFPLRVVPSSGGASAGRNAAVRALGEDVDILGFPNDDSRYGPTLLEQLASAFGASDAPAAVAVSLQEAGAPRFALPAAGPLNKVSVWRAIEPATFVAAAAFEQVGGFREDLGTGCSSPWQSAEGTDLLLRLLAQGHQVVSRPDLVVLGTGERRDLTMDEIVAKHRRYARGTGFVYREHAYPWSARLRILVAPWVQARRHDPVPRISMRIAKARSLGRLEGLLGRTLPAAGARSVTTRP